MQWVGKLFFVVVLLNTSLLSNILAQTGSVLTFSEIMFSPSETNGEFVEIYNTSTTETVDLTNYKFKYYTSSNNNIIALSGGMLLGPGKFAVILQGNYDYTNGIYKTLIPADAIVLKISTNSFGSSGMANTTSREVYLINAAGQTIDTYTYSADNSAGISDEKYILSKDNTAANWKNSLTTNGTPGKKNSASPLNNDLNVTFAGFTPSTPKAEDTLKVTVKIKNTGRLTAANYSVSIFNDVNNDSLGQAGESIYNNNYSNLASGDSIMIQRSIYAPSAADYHFIASADYTPDENTSNNKAFLKITVTEKPAASNEIVINEFMYSPSNDEPEWIELYNRSYRAINLKNWKITDNSTTVTISTTDYFLNPGEYLVICSDATISNYYQITSKILIKQLPTLNNSGDDIILRSNFNTTIDSLKYASSWGGSGNKSLEKINVEIAGVDPSNWKTSQSKFRATPGRINSVTAKANDLSIKSISSSSKYAEIGSSIKLNIIVENLGSTTTQTYSIKIYKDQNFDNIEDPNELAGEITGSNITLSSTMSYDFTVTNLFGGVNQIIVKIDFINDEYPENNSAFFRINGVTINELKGDLVINEIMYGPTSPEPEWIEVYNRSSRIINMLGYKIADDATTARVINSSLVLNPGNYLVIAKDSSIVTLHNNIPLLRINTFASLNNSGDRIVLLDSLNRTIDSLDFKSTWGGSNGKSLERIDANRSSIDSANWKTSPAIAGSTPGRINSVTAKANDLSLKNVSSSLKYAEINGNVKLNIVVENLGTSVTQSYSIKIYKDLNFDNIEDQSELVGEIPGTNIALNSSKSFDFIITNILSGVNQIIAKIDFTNDEYPENNSALFRINGVTINELKGDLVINEIMYGPTSPEQEWIEIYNKSLKQINLKGYKISNLKDTTKVINTSILLQPEDYFVIAKDTTAFIKYPKVPKLIVSGFPTLSNTRDKLILLDSLNRTIDSLEYKSLWGGSGGKSLEKIDAVLSSTDSLNWRTSTNTIGATPGFVNSVSKKNFDLSVTKVIFTPFNPLAGQRVTIKTEVVNIGKQNTSFKIILNEVMKDESRLKIEESPQLSLQINQSLNYNFSFAIESIYVKRNFEVVAEYVTDEDQANNKYLTAIRPGYFSQAVILNEIMYNPANGEPEWLELYNNSQFDIDLEEWSIIDVLTTPSKTKIQAKDFNFPSKTFLVVAKDSTIKNFHGTIPSKLIVSTFANLNNDADGVVLKDSRDVTIDSVRYDSFWGGANGKSLERKSISASSVDRNNWSSSKDIELSTPGRENSITQKRYDLTVNAITTTPQYPLLNEEVNISAKVVNYGLEQAADFTVKFYLKVNNSATFFAEGKGINLNGSDSVWVTSSSKLKLNDNKTILCKVIFSNDEDTLNNSFVAEVSPGVKRNSVLVSEVMYDPLTGESEWIEIYNASSDAVNLINWSISDLLPSPTKSVITSKDNFLNPGEYAITTSDSLHYPYYPPRKFFQAKFGSLSSTDGVLIYDFRNAIIDSLKYNSGWGGAKGYSMERLSFTSTANDSLNWATTLNPNGGTAGIKNSVVNTTKYSFGSLVINEIMFDPAAGDAEYLEFYNTTNDSIQLGGMEIRIGSSAKFKLANTFFKLPPQNYFVLASDSSIYRNFSWLKLENKTKIAGSSSLSLSNEGALLILKDLRGDTLDSLIYSSSWHNKNILTTKGKSLERLNPLLGSNVRANWNTSVVDEGGSPGKQNSIYSENTSRESKVVISPNPFSPDNDGYEDYTIINFDLTKPLSQVRIKVFDSLGRLVRNIAENRLASSKNSVIFDGLDDNGRPLRIGIYILLIEAVAEGSGNVDVIKTPVVIARKL